MLLTSVICSCQLCSFRYMVVATVLGWILAELYFLLTYWLSSSDISLFLVTQMWKERNWLNQSLEDCGRKVFKRLVCRSCDNYEVFFYICMLERLENCKMWLWRKVLNITWSDKVCKEEVLRHVGEERAIISVINRRQRVWLSHTLRHCDLVPLVIEGRIQGKRPPGRPWARMLDRVKDGSPYIAVKRHV